MKSQINEFERKINQIPWLEAELKRSENVIKDLGNKLSAALDEKDTMNDKIFSLESKVYTIDELKSKNRNNEGEIDKIRSDLAEKDAENSN